MIGAREVRVRLFPILVFFRSDFFSIPVLQLENKACTVSWAIWMCLIRSPYLFFNKLFFNVKLSFLLRLFILFRCLINLLQSNLRQWELHHEPQHAAIADTLHTNVYTEGIKLSCVCPSSSVFLCMCARAVTVSPWHVNITIVPIVVDTSCRGNVDVVTFSCMQL